MMIFNARALFFALLLSFAFQPQAFSAGLPVVTTKPAIPTDCAHALLVADVNPNQSSTTLYFEYGIDTNYGTIRGSIAVGNGSSVVTTNITTLSLNNPGTYHYRAVAYNSFGTSYGADQTFKPYGLPIVSSKFVTNLTTTSATIGAWIIPNGSPATIRFEYGPSYQYSTPVASLSNSATAVPVSFPITNLTVNVACSWRIYATNSCGALVGVTGGTFTPRYLSQVTPFPITGVANGALAWADYDNDGYLDLLTIGSVSATNSVARLWRNLGGNAFTNIDLGFPGVSNSTAAWADYDNDGYLDLLIAGNCGTSNLCQVWRNTGSGFVDIEAGLPGFENGSVAWGDYDNDGRPDILLSGNTGTNLTTQLWRNTATGFVRQNLFFTGLYKCAVAWCDYDGDGNLDFVASGSASTNDTFPYSILYHGDGSGSFSFSQPIPQLSRSTAAWGDFDNDGDVDLLLSGDDPSVLGTGPGPINYFSGGTFYNTGAGVEGVLDGTMRWGDFDNDGKLDVGECGSHVKIFRNLGTGSFTNADPGFTDNSLATGRATWADTDNDGKLDFLFSGKQAGGACDLQLWKNNSAITNHVPNAPTNLVATPITTGVLLKWNAATDAETPSKGLNYNVRIGTFPGGGDVVSPQSDSTTGFRRLPELGNAGYRTNALYTKLIPFQTYYWSVQAIDTAFAGSPFAAEGSFVAWIPADVTTSPATNLLQHSATLLGAARPNLLPATVYFQYDTNSQYRYSTPAVQIGDGSDWVNLAADITGLTGGTRYVFRVVASNAVGVVHTSSQSVTTALVPPDLQNVSIKQVTHTSVSLTGSVNPRAGATETFFDYGLSTNYGNVSVVTNVSGTSFVAFTLSASNLFPGATYHCRAVATNSEGATYGSDLTFAAVPSPLLNWSRDTNSYFNIQFTGVPNTTYHVLGSTNLPIWTNITTLSSSTTNFSFSQFSANPAQFYKIGP